MPNKTDFSKRLTLLFLKDETDSYDSFFLETFASVITTTNVDEA